MSRYVLAEIRKRAIVRVKASAAIQHLRNLEVRQREFPARHADAAEAARRRTRRWPVGSGHEAHRDRAG